MKNKIIILTPLMTAFIILFIYNFFYKSDKNSLNQESCSDIIQTANDTESTSETIPTTEISSEILTETLSETSTETSETYNEYDEISEPEISIQDKIISSMTLEEKIYQLFIVTPEELTGDFYDCVTYYDYMVEESIIKKPVGGVIYFSNNLESPEQTIRLNEDIQKCAGLSGKGIKMFIAVDEEGGDIARVSDKLGDSNYGSAAYMETTEEAYNAGVHIGDYLTKYGFNLDFAPVADVDICPDNELGSRIFSDDAEIVSDMVSAMVEGLQSSGKISATLKHFPGLGAESGNTHYDSYTRIDRTYDELYNTEFQAFKGGISSGADFVMVGHQILSCAEDDLPSDLSYTVITEWLRNQLGFDGIIITDSHEMNTITNIYDSAEAAIMSLNAGADIILMPENLEEAVEGIENAVYDGTITESRIDESLYRILDKKLQLGLLNSES